MALVASCARPPILPVVPAEAELRQMDLGPQIALRLDDGTSVRLTEPTLRLAEQAGEALWATVEGGIDAGTARQIEQAGVFTAKRQLAACGPCSVVLQVDPGPLGEAWAAGVDEFDVAAQLIGDPQIPEMRAAHSWTLVAVRPFD